MVMHNGGHPAHASSPPQTEAKTNGDAAVALVATLQKLPPTTKISASKEYVEFVSLLWDRMIHPRPRLFLFFLSPALSNVVHDGTL